MKMDMTTSTGSSMAMPTPNASTMDIDMNMEQMNMAFFTSTTTLLWTKSFAPTTTGQYAGVCIFLIALTIIFRILLAIHVNFYSIRDGLRQRRTKGLLAEHPAVEIGQRPWRANEAAMLGAIDVVIAGVSYLLMLAVMTMNVGYFLSVLAGVFLGSVICSRYSTNYSLH
ncbi:hypothetical protein FSHL1_007924 [Fusarium sambucinum]